MANADLGAEFFLKGVAKYRKIPKKARPLVFQICSRQLILSSSISLETYEFIPKLAKEIGDDKLLIQYS